jgi:hypothetical protein
MLVGIIDGASSPEIAKPIMTPLTDTFVAKGETAISILRSSQQNKENHCEDESKVEDQLDELQDVELESAKIRRARIVKDLFMELVYPQWRELVQERRELEESSEVKTERDLNSNVKPEDGDAQGKIRVKSDEAIQSLRWGKSETSACLERFDRGEQKFPKPIHSAASTYTTPGHVYTRIVQKCARMLGILKDHQFELEVLENLLSQRWWQRGQRGKWHERRTLILMTHCGGAEAMMRRAMNSAMEGLKDEDTHIGQCTPTHSTSLAFDKSGNSYSIPAQPCSAACPP